MYVLAVDGPSLLLTSNQTHNHTLAPADTDEENDADVADCEKVHDINHAYIAQDATIILHVIPASQDPATLESWKVCNKVDRSHQRTIQVLTKLDIAPRDLEKAWLGRIAGAVDDQYSKAMALHVLRCRAGHEIEAGMTLPELHEEEARLAKRWLNDATAMTPLGCTPPTDCFGQTSLVQALSRLLVARIQANLPAIRAQIQRQLDATIMQLESLGEPLDTTHAKRKLLNTLRAAVRRGIDSVTAGSPLNQLSSEPMSIWECLNMLEDVMQGSIAECLDRWLREDLVALEMSNADTEMKFARIKSSDITAERLATKLASAKATAMRREDTISDAAGLTTWSTHEQPIAETKRAVPPAAHDQVARPKRAVPAAARDQIAHLIRMRRSHRLSGFLDFGLFSGIVDNVLARSRQHMQQFCQCVAALVSHVLSHILNPRFNVVHPNNAAMQALQGHVLESAMRRFQECCDEVISDMAKVCLNETSPSRATIVAQAVDTTTANGEFVDAKELLQLLKAYWSYSSRRLADNVALTCRRAFIKQFLQHKIEATLDDIGDATLEAVACEAPHTVARRAALQEACQAYERALEIIEGASVVLG